MAPTSFRNNAIKSCGSVTTNPTEQRAILGRNTYILKPLSIVSQRLFVV